MSGNLKKKKLGANLMNFSNKFCQFEKFAYFCSPNKRRWFKMIIVPIKEGENIERALKKFKRKFEKTGIVRELRNRKTFVKKSVARREEIKKAIYVQHLRLDEE